MKFVLIKEYILLEMDNIAINYLFKRKLFNTIPSGMGRSHYEEDIEIHNNSTHDIEVCVAIKRIIKKGE